MVLGKDSRKPWGRWDFLLARSFQRYNDERCPKCGNPIWLCHNEDSRISFKAVADVCFASMEVETKQSKKKEHEPGVTYVPELELIGDGSKDLDISDLRVPYYKALAIRKGLIPPVDS